MRHKFFFFFAVAASLALIAGLLSSALAQGAGNGRSRHLIFTNNAHAVNEAARQGVEAQGGLTLREIEVGPDTAILAVLIPDRGANQLASIRGVRGVFPDPQAKALCHKGGKDPKGCDSPPPPPEPDPTEPAGEQLFYGVDRIDADMVWSTDGQPGIGTTRSVDVSGTATITGEGVIVAIMDSGVDFTHPDLAGNLDINGDGLVNGADGHVSCVDGTCSDSAGSGGDAIDDHGTHVAGIVAATDNNIGVIGTAPRAKLLSINIFDGGGAFFSDIIAGYQYLVIKDGDGNIVGRRADVVNKSWGFPKNLKNQCPFCVSTLKTSVNEAWAAGVVQVAAAGNEGNEGNKNGKGDNIGYPARLDNVVAVGATDEEDSRYGSSSTGPDLDAMAPGVRILSTVDGGGYDTFNGTSMASPHGAGAAALVIHALGVGWSNADVVSALISTADDLGRSGFDEKFGHGLIDAQEAATGVESTP